MLEYALASQLTHTLTPHLKEKNKRHLYDFFKINGGSPYSAEWRFNKCTEVRSYVEDEELVLKMCEDTTPRESAPPVDADGAAPRSKLADTSQAPSHQSTNEHTVIMVIDREGIVHEEVGQSRNA